MTKMAAVQQDPVVADVSANLTMCERIAVAAAGAGAGAGAEIIVLPEFFTTRMGFLPELADRALPPDCPAADLLSTLGTASGDAGRTLRLHRAGPFFA